MGNPQEIVELNVLRLRLRSLADPQHRSLVRGQHHRRYLVGLQRLAHRGPRGMHPLAQKRVLDRHQEVIGQHAQEDVRLHAPLELMEDRSLRQRALHRPKC